MSSEERTPGYRCIVLPWLRAPMQRFVMKDWKAITIGPLIFSWTPLDAVDLAHEIAHVRQWRKHGIAYIWRYFAASRAAEKAGKDRYWDNEFEIEARAEADAAVARAATEPGAG